MCEKGNRAPEPTRPSHCGLTDFGGVFIDSWGILQFDAATRRPINLMTTKKQAPTEGWTFEEAFRRTANRSVLKRINFDDLGDDAVLNDVRELEAAFWTQVKSGRLVVTASIKKGPSRVLDPEYLCNCEVKDWRDFSVTHRGEPSSIKSVRVYPVLRAPDVINRLAGLGLVDAFEMFVVEDPEVVALNHFQDDPSSLMNGMFPGPFVDYHWPLNYTAENLAYAFVRPFTCNPESPIREPSQAQRDIADALSDRLTALKDSLVRGLITAKGTFSKTGEIVTIDSMQWKRDGISINVMNGDLCFEVNNKPEPIWTGLSFVKGRTVRNTPPPRTGSIKSKISAHFSAVQEAVLALWPEGMPNNLTCGIRDQKIMDWLKPNSPIKAVSGRTIIRYFKRYGARHRRKARR
jgi:hypothetical protein